MNPWRAAAAAAAAAGEINTGAECRQWHPSHSILLSTPLCVTVFAFTCFVQMIEVATKQVVGWVGEGDQLPGEGEEGIRLLEAHASLSLPINSHV